MAYFGRDFANRKQFMNTSIIAGSSSVRSMQTYIFRYDLGYIYSIDYYFNRTCEKILVSNDDFFSMWSWLQDSQFLYHDDFFNMDIWGSQYQIMLGVSPDQPTYPVYFASPYATMGFVGFNPIAPSASQFDVPHFCLNATLKENEDETIHYQRIFNPNYLFKSKPSKTKEDSNMPAFPNIMNIIDLKSKGKFN
jgi:hypothetical protein